MRKTAEHVRGRQGIHRLDIQLVSDTYPLRELLHLKLDGILEPEFVQEGRSQRRENPPHGLQSFVNRVLHARKLFFERLAQLFGDRPREPASQPRQIDFHERECLAEFVVNLPRHTHPFLFADFLTPGSQFAKLKARLLPFLFLPFSFGDVEEKTAHLLTIVSLRGAMNDLLHPDDSSIRSPDSKFRFKILD